jgi:hypothetical protein
MEPEPPYGLVVTVDYGDGVIVALPTIPLDQAGWQLASDLADAFFVAMREIDTLYSDKLSGIILDNVTEIIPVGACVGSQSSH